MPIHFLKNEKTGNIFGKYRLKGQVKNSIFTEKTDTFVNLQN
jgi:hypothetical protein